MNNNNYRSTCAIAMTVDLFGDKWSLLILRDMLLWISSFILLLEMLTCLLASVILPLTS